MKQKPQTTEESIAQIMRNYGIGYHAAARVHRLGMHHAINQRGLTHAKEHHRPREYRGMNKTYWRSIEVLRHNIAKHGNEYVHI